MSLARVRPPSGAWAEFFDALDVQRHVVGALIMRELHTRYGRENIGYLWMLLEPALLAVAVATLHAGVKSYGSGVPPVSFALGGYCTFMIFRSIVSRAESTLHANQPLLFHRTVTVFDMLLARAVLETLSTVATLMILLGVVWTAGLGGPPAQPLTFGAAILLLTWFSFATSMLVCAATYFSKAVAKFIHPLLYIFMPLSGAFFVLAWIPLPYRNWLALNPVCQIFELLHAGQFSALESAYADPVYIVGWCLGLTLTGLLSLRIVRRHVHLS